MNGTEMITTLKLRNVRKLSLLPLIITVIWPVKLQNFIGLNNVLHL